MKYIWPKALANLNPTIPVRPSIVTNQIDFELDMPIKQANVKQNRFCIVYNERSIVQTAKIEIQPINIEKKTESV
jgi:hypothetical protein